MPIPRNVKVIAEKIRHKVAVTKNEAKFTVKSAYIDFKYFLKNIKTDVQKLYGQDRGTIEQLKQSASHIMDHNKLVFEHTLTTAQEEYQHRIVDALVRNPDHQNNDL